MSHTKYATECVVLGMRHVRDADAYVYLLTRSLGYVAAYAMGVRKLASMWRVTGVSPVYVPSGILGSAEKTAALARITAFLRRFFVGEVGQSGLFDDIVKGVMFFDGTLLTHEEIHYFETVMMVRILFHLGYVRLEEGYREVVLLDWGRQLLQLVAQHERVLIAAVNRAIRHSHL